MKKSILAIILFSLSLGLFADGYKIAVKISDLADSTIYLGHHFGSKQYLKDTIRLDKNGEGVFKSNKKLPGGIYLIVLPGMKYFEFLIDKNQQFSMEANSKDAVNNLKFKNSDINMGFNEYQRFMIKQQTDANTLRERLKVIGESSDSSKIIKDKLNTIDQDVIKFWNKTIDKYPGTILASIIKAMKTVEIPEFKIDESITNKDSVKWVLSYVYNKEHYFDNIDFADSCLLRSPLFEDKLDFFTTKLVLQVPDTLILETDRILKKAKANKEVFQTTLVYFINHYQKSNIMGMDKVFVHVAEEYYLAGQAPWADSTFISKLKERVLKLKPNLIGNVAPDLKMETNTGEFVRLHEVTGSYTILVFWEPDCGHCKKEIPKLYEVYQKYKDQGLKVFAVYTQFEKDKWDKFIEEHGLDWINVYDPYNITNFRNFYDVIGTPSIYLLDKDKKIFAKKISAETLDELLGYWINKKG